MPSGKGGAGAPGVGVRFARLAEETLDQRCLAKGIEHALDCYRNLVRVVADRNGHRLHAGRTPPHSSGHRDHIGRGASYPRTQDNLTLRIPPRRRAGGDDDLSMRFMV